LSFVPASIGPCRYSLNIIPSSSRPYKPRSGLTLIFRPDFVFLSEQKQQIPPPWTGRGGRRLPKLSHQRTAGVVESGWYLHSVTARGRTQLTAMPAACFTDRYTILFSYFRTGTKGGLMAHPPAFNEQPNCNTTGVRAHALTLSCLACSVNL